ncbi:hypothetical protein BJY01DRAFT_256182 [Aspergillus pseudoustus]|uniref:BTB domain-containing protein n=1 Tax=Aspergillus pseudoustus TaxID=1810923 RepID=A0ABR4IFL4_9EURO
MTSSTRVRVPKENGNKANGPTITILVGTENKVPGGNPQPARSASPQSTPEPFALYIHWLYFGTLPVGSASSIAEYLALAQAYVFADKVLDGRLQDATIDVMIEQNKEFLNKDRGVAPAAPGDTICVREYSPGSPIRRLLVDMWATFAGPVWLIGSHLHKELMNDLATAWPNPPNVVLDPGRYHCHQHVMAPKRSSFHSTLVAGLKKRT